MCIILFAYKKHPKYRLILAANRDEYYDRPSKQAEFWQDKPHILAGRDLEKMGTWMGITLNGRFAALTNFRDSSAFIPNAQSRGELVSEFLSTNVSPREYITKVINNVNYYNDFNLLVGDNSILLYVSKKQKKIKELHPGIYGLSNNYLDSNWPKVTKGKKMLAKCLIQNKVKPECLFNILSDTSQARDEELPNTGIGLERERLLSSIKIISPNYGTRSSTLLLISNDSDVTFIERSHLRDIEHFQEKSFNFKINN